MPVIKPRTTQKQLVRHITRLYRENNETLFAYAKFIGEPTEYVLNQLVDSVLGKDKDFQAWREQNAGSFVPKPGERTRARGRAFPRPAVTDGRPAAPVAQTA
ncbi:MAG: hypothetical protein HY655_03425 [Acidobacteria bacterium]|nr:hypothetical protein [Acidobacteriota bacterium]